VIVKSLNPFFFRKISSVASCQLLHPG